MQVQMNNQPESPLAHLLTSEANCRCFQCGRSTKQWAELNHAIYLCLNCAAIYKELTWLTKVQSIAKDQWSPEDVARMEKGGNSSFYQFLHNYQLQDSPPREKLTSKAAKYYRDLLDGKEVGAQPTSEVGKEVHKEDIPLGDMSPEELLSSAKDKAVWFGSRTKELGSRGIRKIQEKYESGELKQGAKNVATKVSDGASWLWGTIKEKVQGNTQKEK